jgi:hypothetical protein
MGNRLPPTGAGSGHIPVLPVARWVKAVDVNTAADLALAGALAAIWLTAGLLVDGLPAGRTARQLRRRAATLSLLVGAGAAVFVAVALVAYAMPGASQAPAAALLPAVPAMVVLTASLRRLTQIRRGAGAFATAPLTPAPPSLRAAAAHPLVVVPLQVTGLATLVGLPIAAGLVRVPGTAVADLVITAVGLAVVVIGLRAVLRHSRFSVRVVAPLKRAPRGIASRVG